MLIAVDDASGIGVLTLNRPPRQRNPLSVATMREVITGLRALAADSRVIVIRADGPVFSAGHDLREMIGAHPRGGTCDLRRVQRDDAHRAVDPTAGHRLGAGTCGRRRMPAGRVVRSRGRGHRRGVRDAGCADRPVLFAPMVAVSRAVGRKRALQMLLTGDTIDAETAADWGLVNFVVPPEELEIRTTELAAKIVSASSATVRIGKEAFYRQIDLPQDEAYDAMAETMAENAVICDAQEGMSAFVEKRAPPSGKDGDAGRRFTDRSVSTNGWTSDNLTSMSPDPRSNTVDGVLHRSAARFPRPRRAALHGPNLHLS